MRSRENVTLFAFVVLALFLTPFATQADQATGQNVVVHLGHHTDDLHASSMGMSIARLLQKRGAQVTVFLDREGVRLADARGPKNLRWGAKKESVTSIFADFVKAGGSVVLCPHCAKSAGIDKSMLLTGARIGSQDDVASLFLEADKIIDY